MRRVKVMVGLAALLALTWGASGSGTFSAKTLPEPGTLLLLGAGMLGVSFHARRLISRHR